MKKFILFSAACLFFLGSQLSFAQTTADFAKKKTNEISNMFERTDKLEASQKEKIYDIFASVEKKVKGVETIKDSSLKSAKMEKLQAYINEKLQSVLTAEQYNSYLKNMPK